MSAFLLGFDEGLIAHSRDVIDAMIQTYQSAVAELEHDAHTTHTSFYERYLMNVPAEMTEEELYARYAHVWQPLCDVLEAICELSQLANYTDERTHIRSIREMFYARVDRGECVHERDVANRLDDKMGRGRLRRYRTLRLAYETLDNFIEGVSNCHYNNSTTEQRADGGEFEEEANTEMVQMRVEDLTGTDIGDATLRRVRIVPLDE